MPLHLFRCAAPLALALICVFSAAAATADEAAAELGLDEAIRLALAHQPQLEAQRAAVASARASAVAAAQLPDPRLSFGVTDLTVTGPDAYTLRRESDTQLMLGLSQDFPRGDSRQLQGERARRLADWQNAELAKLRREVIRDTALAWIEVWRPERAQALAQSAGREAELQAQAAEIAYRTGKATQAELLAARVALESLRDEADGDAQQAAHARNQLSRWLAADAARPLPAQLPATPPPPPLDELLAQLRAHPHLSASARQVEIARSDVALAEQGYKPAYSLELDYGYRPDYADYASLKVGMDLPFFTRNRQDQTLAARLAELQRAQSLADDDWRMHSAELRLNYRDWELLQQRLARFDQQILPQAQTRIDAALLAWQAGSGTLLQVLEARRAALELRLQRLDLETDNARHQVQLHYLTGERHEP